MIETITHFANIQWTTTELITLVSIALALGMIIQLVWDNREIEELQLMIKVLNERGYDEKRC